MKFITCSRPILVVFGLLLGHSAAAQLISIPLPHVQLANSSLPAVTIDLNGIFKNGLPTPFVINDAALKPSAQWFCMDPLQTIYYAGSGEPAGNSLIYGGSNPANYDLWGANAPGLSTARVQNLADLFQAYLPQANNALTLGAIQLAVWEIANESNANAYGLGTGYLSITSYNGTGANSMISLANTLLASLNTAAVMNRGNVAALDFLIDGTYHRIGGDNTVLVQDLVGFTPVPEPSTYGLAVIALLAAVATRRQFRAKQPDGMPAAV